MTYEQIYLAYMDDLYGKQTLTHIYLKSMCYYKLLHFLFNKNRQICDMINVIYIWNVHVLKQV